MTEPTEAPFEKTFRLVCRLDDADIDYVRDTAEWIARCVARTLQLNPESHADDVTPIVVDMSTRGRWRLIRPETVAEQLALVSERPETFEVQFTVGQFGWVVVRLAGVERDELAELTFEAWRLTAPVVLVQARHNRLPS